MSLPRQSITFQDEESMIQELIQHMSAKASFAIKKVINYLTTVAAVIP